MRSSGASAHHSNQPFDIGSSAAAFFGKVTEAVQRVTVQTTEKLKNHINEFEREERAFGPLWEILEISNACGSCKYVFENPIGSKHHCRSCGGVFCINCCPQSIPTEFEKQHLILPALIPMDGEEMRICLPCRRGEGPSKAMKDVVKKILENDPIVKLRKSEHLVDKLGNKLLAKMGDAVGVRDEELIQGCQSLALARGSYFGENNMPRRAPMSTPLAISGYIEIVNKSAEVFGIKILTSFTEQSQALFEIPRPTYFAGKLNL
jgi:hypothetical protein